MPDLDLIKQGEQGVRDRRGAVCRGPVGQSRRPPARRPAPVYGWFTEGFDTADLKDAKALLDQLA
jgi:hypothetical protein